jgi:hypothetical protein
MTRGLTLIVAALVALAPFGVSAQTTPPAQPGTAAGAAAAPAAPATKPAEKKPAVTLTPYGFIQVNALFNDGNYADAEYPGFVQTAGSVASAPSFHIAYRSTRVGVRLGFPEALGAQVRGVIEADFRGGFPGGAAPQSFDLYQPQFRLRLAYGQATWKTGLGNFALLLGSEYGLVTPLFATSITYTGAPLYQQAGNPWHRTPQARLSLETPGAFGVVVQAAALSPLDRGAAAQNASANAATGPGNRSRRPDFEGRFAVNMKSGTTKVVEVGAAGHVGWERYSMGPLVGTTLPLEPTEDVRSEMFGLDAQVNTKFVGLKAEAWKGSNVEDYLVHPAGEGVVLVAPTATAAGSVRSLRTRGAWAQAVVNATKTLQLTGGAGAEEPEVDDYAFATPTSTIRGMNRMLSAGIIFAASSNWKAGVEAVRTLTKYNTSAGSTEFKGNQLAVSTQFTF